MLRWLQRMFGKRAAPGWEPPIQALDAIDIVGQRHDGGVDLVIVNSNPADVSPETRELLRRKIAGYLQAINSDAFQEEFGFPSAKQTRIVVTCQTEPHRTDAVGRRVAAVGSREPRTVDCVGGRTRLKGNGSLVNQPAMRWTEKAELPAWRKEFRTGWEARPTFAQLFGARKANTTSGFRSN